jgi:hypothetical protein
MDGLRRVRAEFLRVVMDDKLEIAFTTAGHEALRVVGEFGPDDGREILRGYVQAFARALCAIDGGSEETRIFLDQTLPKPTPKKPTLVANG